jgi:hypothetical protein
VNNSLSNDDSCSQKGSKLPNDDPSISDFFSLQASNCDHDEPLSSHDSSLPSFPSQEENDWKIIIVKILEALSFFGISFGWYCTMSIQMRWKEIFSQCGHVDISAIIK